MKQGRQLFGQREANYRKVIRGEFAYTGGELQLLPHDFDPEEKHVCSNPHHPGGLRWPMCPGRAIVNCGVFGTASSCCVNRWYYWRHAAITHAVVTLNFTSTALLLTPAISALSSSRNTPAVQRCAANQPEPAPACGFPPNPAGCWPYQRYALARAMENSTSWPSMFTPPCLLLVSSTVPGQIPHPVYRCG